jgi:drug/metabolite transporter (DMT)-like permease
MRPIDYARLFALAAIWGGSFIFLRIIAPSLGPIATADSRVLIAGVVLVIYFRAIGFDPAWRTHWRHYVVIGVLNSAIPFVCFAFAALHLPAAYSAIINSLSPLFGACFGVLWLGERFTPWKVAGLALGVSGVALVAYRGGAPVGRMAGWAMLACVGATICYGLTGVYLKKFAAGVPPLAMAGCSQLAAGFVLLPAVALQPPTGPFTATVLACAFGLALLSSAIAYVLYFRLMADVGPTRALTVTFLVPGFGMGWAALFLGERITAPMIIGLGLVILGTLSVGGTLKTLFAAQPRRA